MLDKEFNFANNPKSDGYPNKLGLMVYKILIKRFLVEQLTMKTCLTKNYQKNCKNLSLKNSEKKLRNFSIDKISGADLL